MNNYTQHYIKLSMRRERHSTIQFWKHITMNANEKNIETKNKHQTDRYTTTERNTFTRSLSLIYVCNPRALVVPTITSQTEITAGKPNYVQYRYLFEYIFD